MPGLRFAIGSIKYPGSTRQGWLLYLKPTYQGTERADVRSYASGHTEFPHESTTDQWFSESQLESYRALGASIAEYICSGGAGVPAGKTPAPLDFEGGIFHGPPQHALPLSHRVPTPLCARPRHPG